MLRSGQVIKNQETMKTLEIVKITLPPSLITLPPPHYEEYIYLITYLMVQSLWILPKERIDGFSVPTVVFKDQVNKFHAFLMAITVSFSFSVLTIYTRRSFPEVAGHLRRVSAAALAVTLLLILWAAALSHC